MGKYIMFYGEGCSLCHAMMPLIDKLIEEGFDFEKKEVWHNESNEAEMKKYSKLITEKCGGLGVPAFVDLENNDAVCGEFLEDSFRKWLNGKQKA